VDARGTKGEGQAQLMTFARVNYHLDTAADWQRQIRLRDPGTQLLVPISSAVMEIRNANFQLALRLDATSGRCLILSDGCTISLHITAADSVNVFAHGNYPGQYQAIGIWGIGRSYLHDLYVVYAQTGVQERIIRGFFYVNPNITQFPQLIGAH
jgi:hypothetical protein